MGLIASITCFGIPKNPWITSCININGNASINMTIKSAMIPPVLIILSDAYFSIINFNIFITHMIIFFNVSY